MKRATEMRKLCLKNFNCACVYVSMFGVLAEGHHVPIMTVLSGRRSLHRQLVLWKGNLSTISCCICSFKVNTVRFSQALLQGRYSPVKQDMNRHHCEKSQSYPWPFDDKKEPSSTHPCARCIGDLTSQIHFYSLFRQMEFRKLKHPPGRVRNKWDKNKRQPKQSLFLIP